ncbi:MAG: hypothetical protein MMC33_002747 [Icmadophila ericetorum]|nr:hypothetical protein [Icmadophila ericetorum]
MFREPEEVQTKSALKADPSAAARSSIRRRDRVTRQHRPRHSPYSPLRASSSRDLDVMHHRRSSLDILRRDRENASESIDRNIEIHNADLARAEASNRRRMENGRALLRDALSYEHPGVRLRRSDTIISNDSRALSYGISASELEEWRQDRLEEEDFIRDASRIHAHYPWPELTPPPPPREAREARDPRDPGLHRDYIYPPPRPSPPPARSAGNTPPPDYTRGLPLDPNHPARRSPLAYSTSHRGAAPFTPGFAPAFGAHSSYNIDRTLAREDELVSPPGGPRPITILRDYFASHSSSHPSGNTRLDGLGDRRRSFTPEENPWETLLTTIPADERLPSAESSFTSASASAAAPGGNSSSLSSNNSAASSSATIPTAASSVSSAPATTIPICDLESTDSEDGCSETEDDDFQAVHLREYPRHSNNNSYARNPALSSLANTARLLNSQAGSLSRPRRLPRGTRDQEIAVEIVTDGPGRSLREARAERMDRYSRMIFPEERVVANISREGSRSRREARDDRVMVEVRQASPRTRRRRELAVRERELDHMHAILTRMENSQDISEEMWAALGVGGGLLERRERL